MNDYITISPWPGGDFPTIHITKGHMRAATGITKAGNGCIMIGVSDLEVEEASMDYHQAPDETIIPCSP